MTDEVRERGETVEGFDPPSAAGIGCGDRSAGAAPDRMLKHFRYIVASVNDEALKTWAELWGEIKDAATPGGLVAPEASDGFRPKGGWPSFLEKFWELKHYLDCTHRFCRDSLGSSGER